MSLNIPQQIEIKSWHTEGGMMIRTDALDPEHHMHPYNQIKNMGLEPEDYGVLNPRGYGG